jgi:hypothetical protein
MSAYEQRLDSFARRLHDLEDELVELRREATAVADPLAPSVRAETPAPPAPDVHAAVAAMRERLDRVAAPLPASVPSGPPPRPRAFDLPPGREPFDVSRLLGARTLAFTGGVVSLLGIVFFFALALQRGWIGPVARVSLGALASAAMLGAGWWLRRRFGETLASTAAAGVGVAGGYATLLAAAARYDLVSDPVALLLAAGIAAVATALALAWHDQLLAGLGLVGAILAPLAVAVRDDELATTGVAFAVLMLAAAIAVSLYHSWSPLLVVATAVAGTQVAALLLDASGREGAALVLAIALWALMLATGIVLALRGGVTRLAGTYVVVASAFSGYAAAALYDDRALGIALLAPALTNGVLATLFFRRARDLSSLLWAAGLALTAVGSAQLLSDATLTIAWAAEAAVLAWLAERVREPRFRVAALAWLGLALVHALTVDAPLSLLFRENDHPARGVPSLLALAAAAAWTAWLRAGFEREPGRGWAAFAVNVMLHVGRQTRLVLAVAASLLTLEAASLALLGLVPGWDRGHVAVTGLWGAVAIGLLLAGRRLPGLAWAGATVALAGLYDVTSLTGGARWDGLAVAAAPALHAALLFERELTPVSGAAAGTGAALAVGAGLGVAGHDLQWLLVLAVGGLYIALGAAFLRARRDQSTLLWALGLAMSVVAAGNLLDGSWLVLALSGAALAATLLARFEERLDVAALSLLALGLGAALAGAATPRDLFDAQRHPGEGAPALVALLAAAVVYARLRARHRAAVIWTAAVVALFAVSLAILELAESLDGSVSTDFQRGHTAVSALWGLVGLALLYAGLVRGSRRFQLAGFGLFGLALVKLFVYDLAYLSSVARALSVLAVGAVLIAGGFFYQRLATTPDQGHRAGA